MSCIGGSYAFPAVSYGTYYVNFVTPKGWKLATESCVKVVVNAASVQGPTARIYPKGKGHQRSS